MSISSSDAGSARRVAVIGGSGFGSAFVPGEAETIHTAYGDATVTRAERDGREIVFLARHGAGHKIPPHLINHRANIAALRDLGVSEVFATAAVGSLRVDMAPGEFVVLDDFVDLTKGEVATFFDKIGDVRHCDFSQPYDLEMRVKLIAAAQECAASAPSLSMCGAEGAEAAIHPAGTYLCLSGPRYETPAEVRLFAQWGLDVVGMTGAPEAILCREAGLRYASIAVVTNYASGLDGAAPLSHDEVEAQMARTRDFLVAVLLKAI